MDRNTLYPVFLKLSNINVLIVGGGYVAEEKLSFIMKSSPDANVKMVATFFREDTVSLANKHQVEMITRPFEEGDLQGNQIVIVTTDDVPLNIRIHNMCKAHSILVNVADNPPYCDFYMGGIVTKGHVKIGISTNGKSPTLAKRLRQFFEEVLPDDINKLALNLDDYRKTLKGDFNDKMEKLNELTKGLIKKDPSS